jgi:hypothetical protein
MVAETSAKLSMGMNVGKKKDGKLQVKYSVGFDGLFPCYAEIFSHSHPILLNATLWIVQV